MSAAVSTRVRVLIGILAFLLAGVILMEAGLWWATRRNLPQLDGTAALPGLSAAVTVDRDSAGVPTIHGSSRLDVARALGYLHAQDRFFQMDLLRRGSAGELAEIFGKAAVPLDRTARVHGFRTLARKALALLPPEQRQLVDAYTAGVNAGLSALRARPFEYWVLRVRPQPWQPEDSLLVGYSMVLDLRDSQDRYEQMLAAIRYSYGSTLFDFFAPEGTEFDAALDGGTFPQPPVPGPDIIDLRKRKPDAGAEIRQESRLARPKRNPRPARMSSPWRAAGPQMGPPCSRTICTSIWECPTCGTGRRWCGVKKNQTPNPKSQGPGNKSQVTSSKDQIPRTRYQVPVRQQVPRNKGRVQGKVPETKEEVASGMAQHRVTGVTLPGPPL